MSCRTKRNASRPDGFLVSALNRPRDRPWALRCGLLVAGALFGLTAATPAAAGELLYNAVIKNVLEPDIRVSSFAGAYTDINYLAAPLSGVIEMSVSAYPGRVKWWKVGPILKGLDLQQHPFPDHGSSKTYPIGDRPVGVHGTGSFTIPFHLYKPIVVDACNYNAGILRDQGKSDYEIFAVDRTITLKLAADISVDARGPYSDQSILTLISPGDDDFDVICERDANIPMIADSGLSATVVQKNQIANACELRLNGSISTHEPNVEVKFRYVEQGGQKSGVKAITTGADGKKDFQHVYPLDPAVQSGKIRMVGTDPDFSSNWANYEVDCSEPASNDIQALLPPKATAMAFDVKEEIFRYGMACPRFVEVTGTIEGRGNAEGKVVFKAAGEEVSGDGVPYSIDDGETLYPEALFEIPWQNTPASKTKHSVNVGMFVMSGQGQVVSQLEGTKHFECYEPLPPKPLVIDVNITQEVERNGMLCPAEFQVRSMIKGGGGNFSGSATLHANADQSDPQPFSVSNTATALVEAPHQISWPNANEYGQFVELSVFVRDAGGEVVSARSDTEFLQCRSGVEIQGVGSTAVLEHTTHNGYMCPAAVQVTSNIASLGPAFSGTLFLGANGQQIGQEGFSVDAPAEEVAGEVAVSVPYPIVWQESDGVEKTIQFSASIRSSTGHEVDSLWDADVIRCLPTNMAGHTLGGAGSEGVASGPARPDSASRGGLALGGEGAPGQRQRGQRRPTAIGQIAVAPTSFAILAPKGRLRPGPRAEIRLSGAAPEDGYTLRFYHRDKGRYKLVRIAGLPQAMDGNRQRLRINALRGSTHWRVEVCPAGASRQNCKTSDFTLAPGRGTGAGQGGQEPEIMLIAPGAINSN